MKSRRFLCICLILTTLGVSSCQSGSTTAGDVTAAETSATTAATEYLDTLPSLDMKGGEFGIMARSEKTYEVYAASENGDILNDAVFERNRAVEDRYNVKLKLYDTEGSWSARENFQKAVGASILAGEDKYDLIAYYEATAQPAVVEGWMMNLNEVDNLDLSQPWWYPGYNDVMNVNGRLYSCLGDLAMTTWEYPSVVYFNKNMMTKYGMEYPYSLAEKGSWTFDRLLELAAKVSGDLDGNGTFNESDLYGWITDNGQLRAMPTAFEFPLTKHAAGGKPELSVGGDKFVSVYKRVYDIIWNQDYACAMTNDDQRTKCFTEGRALFMSYMALPITQLRGMDDDFGLLPYPKYDEKQEAYHTLVFDNHSVLCIPVTATSGSESGLILEALSYESYKTVTPAYYEVMLKSKVSRDSDSERMLDMIRDSFLFDFAIVNSMNVDGIFPFFGNNLVNKNENIASAVASQLPAWEKTFAALLEFYGY